MSSSKYPLLAARWRAVVWVVMLALAGGFLRATPTVSALPSSDEIAGVAAPPLTPPDGFSQISSAPRVVRFSFTGLFLYGGEFVNLTAVAGGSLQGTLQSVSIEIAQPGFSGEPPPNPGDDHTWASDLTILVAGLSGTSPNIDNTSSLNLQLQVGGTTGFLSSTSTISPERQFWYPNIANDPEVRASASYQLINQIVLQGSSAADPQIWLGHGFMTSALAAQSTYGTWTGYVDFTFAGSGGSGVPDASRTALLLAPGTLLLLGLAGRSRRRG
jgi:hypothetical protein